MLPPPADVPLPEEGLHTRRLSTIKPEPVRWFWKGKFPQGKFCILQGDPGTNKTTMLLDCLARLSRGLPFGDGAPCLPGEALFVTSEDGLADTIRPRCDKLGADVRRIHVLDLVRIGGADAHLNIDQHLNFVEAFLEQYPLVRVIVLDPLEAYLGDINTWKSNEVRGVMGRVARLAESRNVTVIGIAHLTKEFKKAVHRSLNSIAFVAAARAVWQVVIDPEDDDRRLLLPVKVNLCKARGQAFRITDGCGIEWQTGEVADKVDEIEQPGQEATPRAEAKDWIRAQLADGPVPSKVIEAKAKEDGIAKNTLMRAKKELAVVSSQENGEWSWSMPDTQPAQPG